MSFTNLLAVSRAFGTIRDAPTRFKMTEENLLPTFGTRMPASATPTERGRLHPRLPTTAAQTHTSATPNDWSADNPVRPVEHEKLETHTLASATEMKTDLLEQSQPNCDNLSPLKNSSGFFCYFSSTWSLFRTVFGPPIIRCLNCLRNPFGLKSPFQSKPLRPPGAKGPFRVNLFWTWSNPSATI